MSEGPSDVPPDQRFAGLTYDAFREMASDPSLSSHERSGFPDSYREGAEEAILADVEAKLPALTGAGASRRHRSCWSASRRDANQGLGCHPRSASS